MPRDFASFLVERDNGCVEWSGVTLKSNGRDSHRYGRYTRGGKKHLAHRVAYEREFGPIPQGMCVLHKCDNTLCCNPRHLFLGTHADNMADMAGKGRTRKCGDPKPRGEDSPKAKLTDAQVCSIRAQRDRGETTIAISAAYGVSPSYISRIARGLVRR